MRLSVLMRKFQFASTAIQQYTQCAKLQDHNIDIFDIFKQNFIILLTMQCFFIAATLGFLFLVLIRISLLPNSKKKQFKFIQVNCVTLYEK